MAAILNYCTPAPVSNLSQRDSIQHVTEAIALRSSGLRFRRRYGDGQRNGDRHHAGNNVETARVGTGSLAKVGDQQWAERACAAPGRQHEAVDWPDILRAKVVGRKSWKGAETSAVAHQDHERDDRDDRYGREAGQHPE